VRSPQRPERKLNSYARPKTYLLLELLHDGHVDRERVLLGADRHGSVVDGANSTSEVGDRLGGHLTLSCDRVGELASVVLDVLDVGLDLGPELLQVLDDGRLDSPGERGVGVGNEPGLVTDSVKDVLIISSRSKGELSDIPAYHPHRGTDFRA
jgi:hypothetical protein